MLTPLPKSLWIALLCMGMALRLVFPPDGYTELLQGRVEAQGVHPPQGPRQGETGMIMDAVTQRPLAGAVVTIPSLRYKTLTGADGQFTLPPAMPLAQGKPLIIGVQKQGYQPQSTVLQGSATKYGKRTFQMTAAQNILVLDQTYRHLGDNTFSPRSAHTQHLTHVSEGPSIRYPFTLDRQQWASTLTLQLGSVIGLDTEEAHRQGESLANVVSSPMVVKLNGQAIAHVKQNGRPAPICLPKSLLDPQGINILEIQTGIGLHREAWDRDYDDVEFLNVVLTFSPNAQLGTQSPEFLPQRPY